MPLLTVGHGTLEAHTFVQLLQTADVSAVIDVRRYPGSRRNPQFGRDALRETLERAGIAYRWAPDLGGRRSARPGSANSGLRNAAFRGYADYMGSPAFAAALARLLDDARRERAAVLCAEAAWRRCHRRLIADAAALLHGARVIHVAHDGGQEPHELTRSARRADGSVVYPAATPHPPGNLAAPRRPGIDERG